MLHCFHQERDSEAEQDSRSPYSKCDGKWWVSSRSAEGPCKSNSANRHRFTAPCVTLMCAQRHSCGYATNATSVSFSCTCGLACPELTLCLSCVGTYGGRCIICGSAGAFISKSLKEGWADIGDKGISDAYYCAECTRLEKDRDGCPKIVNLGAS